MAKQAIGLGTTADDGTGDTLRAGGTKIKENFDELYDLMGDGTDLSSGISATASVITLTAPSIGGVVAGTQTSATITTLTSTTVNPGTLSLAAGSITDSSGDISFVNENLVTTGTLGAGAITTTGAFKGADGYTIGNASVADIMTLASTGIVTFKDDIVIKDGGTIGAASAATAITISSAGLATFSSSVVVNGTITGTSVKDEDNMASDSATHLASQQSIKAYADTKPGVGLIIALGG
jgi:hypothetical protein